MTTLIRSASHGNDVSIIYIQPIDIYRKVSYSSLGKSLINNEYQGTLWYEGLKGNKSNIKRYYSSDVYSRIDIFRIKGKHINYNLSLTECEKYLDACIDHYIEIWPKGHTTPCHGDLTLDNIMFSNTGPVIFDWENFYCKGETWGFDIAYLLMSAVFLPNYNQGYISKKDSSVLCVLWEKLRQQGLSQDIGQYPMEYFIDVFQDGNYWQNIITHSPQKLFPMWSNPKFNKYIQNIIN